MCRKEPDLGLGIISLHGPWLVSTRDESRLASLHLKLIKYYRALSELVKHHLLVELCAHFFPLW